MEPIPKCARIDCQNEGVWQPVLLIYAPERFKNNTAVKAPMGLAICDAHKAETTLDDVLSDAGWAQIVQGFDQLHKARPDRSRTRLAFRPFQDLDADVRAAVEAGESVARVTADMPSGKGPVQ